MTRSIQKAIVLGAGTMGARIAAHFANAGLPCILLDIVPPDLKPDAPPPIATKSSAPVLKPPKNPAPQPSSLPRSPKKSPSAISKMTSPASPKPIGSSKSSPKI